MAEKAKITSGIYVWINKITGQALVGQSLHLRRRKEVHICTANKGAHHNPYFQNAWTKYQKDSFKFVVLELVEDTTLLTAYEQSYLDYYRTLPGGVYNLKGPVDTPRTGSSHTKESRAKISAGNKGKKRTPEQIHKMRMGLIGKKYKPYKKRGI
jgi:group I intron endonuclease